MRHYLTVLQKMKKKKERKKDLREVKNYKLKIKIWLLLNY